MAEPPLEAGAVQVMATEVLAGTVAVMVGAPGTVAGVTALDAADWAPVPTLLMAATLKV